MITPIEIRQHTFKKSLRGFDKDEVQQYLNTLSMEWEKLLGEMKSVKNELDKTKSSLDSFKQMESVLHKTLLQAEQTSKNTLENAKKNAELKVQEAEAQQKQILNGALQEKSRIEMDINELISYRNELLQQMKVLLQTQTERIKSFEEKEARPRPEAHPKRPATDMNGAAHAPAETESFFDTSVEVGEESNMVNEILEEL